jgi:hypothetical protein
LRPGGDDPFREGHQMRVLLMLQLRMTINS